MSSCHNVWAASFAALAIAVVVSAAPGALARAAGPPALAEAPPEVPGSSFNSNAGPFAERFTNVVVTTHEGDNVHFYDDLLKDKVVLINFMYASCEDR